MKMEENGKKPLAEEEVLKKVGEILTKKDDEGFLTDVVSEITDYIHELSAKIVNRDDEINDLKKDIESLREANMNLLRKQGAYVEPHEKGDYEREETIEEEKDDDERLEEVVDLFLN